MCPFDGLSLNILRFSLSENHTVPSGAPRATWAQRLFASLYLGSTVQVVNVSVLVSKRVTVQPCMNLGIHALPCASNLIVRKPAGSSGRSIGSFHSRVFPVLGSRTPIKGC